MKRFRARCVLDASAAVAVLFREPGFGDVLAALPPTGWIAPPLLGTEVANVAKHKVSRGLVTRANAARMIAELSRWNVRRVDPPVREAWDLAWAHDLSLDAAAYLQLAVSRDLPLVTLDRDLRAAAGKRARP